jgi:hypothetical protein
VQRGDVVVDLDRDLRLLVVGQREVRDRADALAADLDLAALHELAGVLEDELVLRPGRARGSTR